MKLRAILFIIVGFILSAPFIYVAFWMEYSPILAILSLIGSLIGGPLFFTGLVALLMPAGRSSSYQDIEIARIRHATESMARRDK